MTAVATPAPPGVSPFDAVLLRAVTGRPAPVTVRSQAGDTVTFDAATWAHSFRAGDRGLLDRCTGPTLDVGCGPGRLTYALSRRGCPALGVDTSAVAVGLARARGAVALRRDVFAALPGRGRWHRVLLADGNIGIGGDPVRLLRRCRDLLAPPGRLLVELAAPGTRSWAGPARMTPAGETAGTPVAWAVQAIDDLPPLAAAAGLTVAGTWTEENRWFATLAPCAPPPPGGRRG